MSVPAPFPPPRGALRIRLRARIARGILPADPPDEVWAVDGADRACDGCDVPVGRGRPHFEARLPSRGGRNISLHFHEACLMIWQEERRRRRTVRGVGDGPAV